MSEQIQKQARSKLEDYNKHRFKGTFTSLDVNFKTCLNNCCIYKIKCVNISTKINCICVLIFLLNCLLIAIFQIKIHQYTILFQSKTTLKFIRIISKNHQNYPNKILS